MPDQQNTHEGVAILQYCSTVLNFNTKALYTSYRRAMATGYPPQQVPAAASVPSTRVELHISCDKLKDMDVFSKSDPIVSVRVKDRSGAWKEVGREVMT